MKKRFLSVLLLVGLLAVPLDAAKKKFNKKSTQLNIANERLETAKKKEAQLAEQLSKMVETTQSERAEKERVAGLLQEAIDSRKKASLDVENLNKQIIALTVRMQAKESEAAALKIEKDQISKEKKEIKGKLEDAVYKNQQAVQTKKKLEKETNKLKNQLKKAEEERALLESVSLNKQKEMQLLLRKLKEDKNKNKLSSREAQERAQENKRLKEEIKKTKAEILKEQALNLKKHAETEELIANLQRQVLEKEEHAKQYLAEKEKIIASLQKQLQETETNNKEYLKHLFGLQSQIEGFQTKSSKVSLSNIKLFKLLFGKALDSSTELERKELTERCPAIKDLFIGDLFGYYELLVELINMSNSKIITMVKSAQKQISAASGLMGLPHFLSQVNQFAQTIEGEWTKMQELLEAARKSSTEAEGEASELVSNKVVLLDDQVSELEARLTSIFEVFQDIEKESTSTENVGFMKQLGRKMFKTSVFKNPLRANSSLTKLVLKKFLNHPFGMSSVCVPGFKGASAPVSGNSAFDFKSEL